MPPLVCPSPEPIQHTTVAKPADADCPLYSDRITERSPTETLRRAILTEHRHTPDLAALIRAESANDVAPAALPPGPTPGASILDQLKEQTNAASTRPSR
jgi:hypothetical protein